MFNQSEKAIFFDRDGVLLREPLIDPLVGYKTEAIDTWEKFEILPTVSDAFRKLKHQPYRLFIISNQEGIEEGFLPVGLYKEMNQRLLKFIKDHGGAFIDRIYTCPHPIDGPCDCRKPRRGLIDQALKNYQDVDLTQSWIIGDRSSDVQLGKLVGARTVFLRMNHKLSNDVKPDITLLNVDEAIDYILKQDDI